MKILKENIIKTMSVIFVAAIAMLMPISALGLITGFNVEITNDTGQDAYDFHLEGTLQSLDIVDQVANIVMPWPRGSIPGFDWTYDRSNITPAPNTRGKYYYSGGWSGTVPVPPGGTIHIGKYWDETCNNKVVDLRGWWTDRNGKKIIPRDGTNGTNDPPLLGFDIQDNIPARLDNPGIDLLQTVTVQNATDHEIQIESPQVAVTDMHILLDELVPDSKVLNSLEWHDVTDAAVMGFSNPILSGRSVTFDIGRIGLIISPGQETILRCRIARAGTNEWRFYAAKCTAHSIHDKNPVGIFEDATDIGGPKGIGSTVYEGYVWECGVLSEQYLLTGGGSDIWGNSDQFHYAYNTVSGDVRISACFKWVVYDNDWAKYGVMLRNSLDPGSVHRFMCERGLSDYAGMQGRVSEGGASSEFGTAWIWTTGTRAMALGIQRVTVEGLTFIEGLADFGNGWESRSLELVLSGFEDEILAGVAITSHNNNCLAQARCWNVQYEANPDLVGEFSAPLVPASANLGACPTDTPGFKIESLKPLVTDGWGYDAVREIFDTGIYKGLPPQPGTKGSRISQFVNVRDTGNGAFSVDNGYPDETYPGVDPDEIPAADPAAGDDDDNHGTQVTGCIQLTAGLHIIGANSDDGTIIEIGGVEVGRTGEWKGASNVDFVFEVEADGCYNLRVLHMEGGGGSSLELHEVLMDGTRILLNDVANGGSAVFTPVIPLPPPEPAS